MLNRNYYRKNGAIFQIVSDGDIHYLYKLKSPSEIKSMIFPWDFIRRFSSLDETIKTALMLTDISSDLVNQSKMDEQEVFSIIEAYKYRNSKE